MDFQVDKLGAGRVAPGVVAGGEASSRRGWRAGGVEKCGVSPAWLEGRPEVPHFTGSLLAGIGVIPAPTLLLMEAWEGRGRRHLSLLVKAGGEPRQSLRVKHMPNECRTAAPSTQIQSSREEGDGNYGYRLRIYP